MALNMNSEGDYINQFHLFLVGEEYERCKLILVRQLQHSTCELEQAAIFYFFGKLYIQQLNYKLAEGYVMKAKEIQERKLGLADYETARTTTLCGICHWKLMKHDLAAKLFREALGIYRMENHDADTFELLCNLSVVEKELGQYEEAEKHLRELLRKVPEDQNACRKIWIMEQLGSVLFSSGNLQCAQKQFQNSVKLRKAYFGEEKRSLIVPLLFLAKIADSFGNFDASRLLSIELISIYEYLYGRNCTQILEEFIRMSRVAQEQKNFEEAEKHLQQALVITTTLYGEHGVRVVNLYRRMGSLYVECNELKKAEEFLLSALHLCSQTSPNNGDKDDLFLAERTYTYGKLCELCKAMSGDQMSAKHSKYLVAAFLHFSNFSPQQQNSLDTISFLAYFGIFFYENQSNREAKSVYTHLIRISKILLGDTNPMVKDYIDLLAKIEYQMKEEREEGGSTRADVLHKEDHQESKYYSSLPGYLSVSHFPDHPFYDLQNMEKKQTTCHNFNLLCFGSSLILCGIICAGSAVYIRLSQ